MVSKLICDEIKKKISGYCPILGENGSEVIGWKAAPCEMVAECSYKEVSTWKISTFLTSFIDFTLSIQILSLGALIGIIIVVAVLIFWCTCPRLNYYYCSATFKWLKRVFKNGRLVESKRVDLELKMGASKTEERRNVASNTESTSPPPSYKDMI